MPLHDKPDMSAAQFARILREARATGAPMAEVIERGLAAIKPRAAQPLITSALPPSASPSAPIFASPSAAPSPDAQHRKVLSALINSGARWPQLQPVAWNLFMLAPADISAAHILEICAIHGTRQDLLDLAATLREGRFAYYFHLHPSVRERLATMAWGAGRFDLVAESLVRSRDAAQLLPAERLVIFLFLSGGSDPSPAFMYFRAHRASILEAAKISESGQENSYEDVVLKAARIALDLGFDFDVRDLVRLISRTSERHPDAVALLNETIKDTPAAAADTLEVQMSEGTWQQRFDVLDKRLAAARKSAGSRDPGRARLNEVLKGVLGNFPQLPEIWGQLSEMIVLNRDLAGILPALYASLQTNALTFHPAPLDAALWQGPLKVEGDATRLLDAWWHGVALLHQYIAHGSGHEETLWKSRRMMMNVSADADFALPFRWSDLLRAATHHVSRHALAGDSEKRSMLAQLTIAGESDSFSAHDIESYLKTSWRTPLIVLNELERIANQKKSPDVRRLAILKKAAVAGLTNHDLDSIWQSANATQSTDLAWRVATVLSMRQVLVPAAHHALQISGEKRGFCPFLASPLPTIEPAVLANFAPREARFIHALLRIGPRLPELLSLFDSRARILKSISSPAGSIEARVDGALKAVKWLPASPKLYRFSHEQAGFGGVALPPFVQVAPASAWGLLYVILGHRLGMNAWNWQVTRLASFVSEMIPRVAQVPEYKAQASKVARWLRDLSAEERIAWQDLSQESRNFTDQEAQVLLGQLLARLTTLIHPDHSQALQSLQQMRTGLPVLRDFEAWLLGAEYSAWRQDQGLASRIMVPLNLRRLDVISK